MKSVIIRPNAEQDIEETYNWFEAKDAGLGDKFKDELRQQIEYISFHPQMYAERETGFRYGLCRKMKVFIAYKIEVDGILVYRVWYATMNPSEWRKKLSSER